MEDGGSRGPLSEVSGRQMLSTYSTHAGEADVGRAGVHLARLDPWTGRGCRPMSCSRSLPAPWMTVALLDLLGGEVGRRRLSASSRARISRLLSGRAQLVRHVGQELGLVAGRQRQLLGPVRPGPGRRPRSPRSSAPARCWCRAAAPAGPAAARTGPAAPRSAGGTASAAPPYGSLAMIVFDRDPDGLGDLVQEGEVGRAERGERGQLDDRQHPALEQHRQQPPARPAGRCPGAEEIRHVAGRDVGEVDPGALGRGLADQRLGRRRSCPSRRRRDKP